MKYTKLCFSLAFLLLVTAGVSARAGTVINFGTSGGNGITFSKTTGGEYMTFANLTVDSTDTSNGASVVISPGTGGHFLLNSVSSDGLTGYFASNAAATITMGNANSGILTGSLALIEIDTNTSHTYPNGHGSFTLTFTLNNLAFSNCTAADCTNSATLKNFASLGNGTSATNTISFNFSGGMTNINSLLGITGSKGTTAAGTMDSPFDTLTPEPGAIGMLGSGLLLLGIAFYARKLRNV